VTSDDVVVKRRADAPEGFFAAEAAGLAWLAQAQEAGGARVVEVLGVGPHEIRLRRVRTAAATPSAAQALGAALAVTHAAGAPAFGSLAPGSGGRAWIGPLALPTERALATGRAGAPGSWGPFFAALCLEPHLRAARDSSAVDADGSAVIMRVCDRLAAADPDLTGPPEPAARLHGDLWAGNVLWTAGGAVLIDPSAHGGHRETDLAMLDLFGAPFLDRVVAAYDARSPLAEGWRDRVGVHQLYPLLVHAVLFGAGYGAQAVAAARRYA